MREYDANYANKIIGLCAEISTLLTKVTKGKMPKFIKRRLIKIAKKHATSVTDKQKLLLAKIASLF